MPWTIDGIGSSFPPDARLRLGWSVAGWHLSVAGPDGSLVSAGYLRPRLTVATLSDDAIRVSGGTGAKKCRIESAECRVGEAVSVILHSAFSTLHLELES